MKRIIIFLAILGFTGIAGMNLYAATLIVSEATDEALRNAIANAGAGDTIAFDPALFVNGLVEILLNGAIRIDKDLSIAGPEGGTVIFDGNQKEILTIASSNPIQFPVDTWWIDAG